MAVKGLLIGGFGRRLEVWGPRTPKLPRAPQNGDPALGGTFSSFCLDEIWQGLGVGDGVPHLWKLHDGINYVNLELLVQKQPISGHMF